MAFFIYRVVKIKYKSLLLGMIVFILLLSTAYAQSKLVFTDVDVKVGSKTSKNLDDGDRISEEAQPGDNIEIRVEVQNNFTSLEDLDIEDISIEAEIASLDEGDDVSEESNSFDLSPSREKRVTLKFVVPIKVDEDDYDVTITAEGEDQNGTEHSAQMSLTLEVQKENHLLKIIKNSLNPADITCGRKNVQLSATVLNMGSEDEEDVSVNVFSADLGVDYRDEIDEMSSDWDDDSNEFSKTYSFNVPASMEAGSYPITIRALYDDDRKKAEGTVTLNVNECATISPTQAGTATAQTEATTGVQDTTGQQIPPSTDIISPDMVVTREPFLGGNIALLGIAAVLIAALVVGFALIVVLLRRR